MGGLFLSDYGGGMKCPRKRCLRPWTAAAITSIPPPGYFNSEEVLGNILTGCQKPLIFPTAWGRPSPLTLKIKRGLLLSMKEKPPAAEGTTSIFCLFMSRTGRCSMIGGRILTNTTAP